MFGFFAAFNIVARSSEGHARDCRYYNEYYSINDNPLEW